VPDGFPHALLNFNATMALSGNYIDESYVQGSIAALVRHGLTCWRAR
jgi:hypothetical protein